MIRNFAPLIVAFLLLSGFAYATHQDVEEPAPQPDETAELAAHDIRVTGVIVDIDQQTETMRVRTATGHEEHVRFDVLNVPVGTLVTVEGSQEQQTQQINAERTEPVDDALFLVHPEPSVTVTSPLIVEGFATSETETVDWRIETPNENVRANGRLPVRDVINDATHQPFRFEIFIPALETASFTMVIEAVSENNTIDDARRPLTLLSTKTRTFDIYFVDQTAAPEQGCFPLVPVKRTIADTAALGRAALLELLTGTTPEEYDAGYRNRVADAVRLQSFVIHDGTATITFEEALPSYYNPCQNAQFNNQITDTLTQFSGIEDVELYFTEETANQP